MTAAPILSYATPRPRSPFLSYYLVFLAATIVPAMFLFLLLIFYIPRFSAIYSQFGGELPQLTILVLKLTYLVQHLIFFPLWLLLLGALPLLPAWRCARHPTPHRRTRSLVLFLLLFLLVFLLAFLLIIISMLLPVFQLQQLIH
jgi:type II secretory pathway component PulF